MSARTFADLPSRGHGGPGYKPRCSVCDKRIGADTTFYVRLYAMKRVGRKGAGSIASKGRTVCKPCAIELFERICLELEE